MNSSYWILHKTRSIPKAQKIDRSDPNQAKEMGLDSGCQALFFSH